MPSYIELDKQSSFPSSGDAGKMIFGVNTSNQATLTDSNGTTYNFGTGVTNSQTFDVDLSLGSYTMLGTGIYRVTTGDNALIPNTLDFPDPSLSVGGTIVVINNDTVNNFPAALGGSYIPFNVGGTLNVGQVDYPDIGVFYSIGGSWRGGKLGGF